MNRRHRATEQRHLPLPAMAAGVIGTTRRFSGEKLSKPDDPGRRF